MSGGASLSRRSLAALALAAGLAAGCGQGPVRVSPPTGPAVANLCAALQERLPNKLGDQARRRTEPASERTAAWGEPAAVLRCGVARPEGYRPELTSIYEIGGVTWYQHIAGPTIEWVVVDRPTYVELAIPRSYDGHGSFLMDLASPIKAALPKQPR